MTTGHAGPRVVVMGVSGSGKSTVGRTLAGLLDLPFLDADALHPPANLVKMTAGTPLTDADRWPWLRAVGTELATRRDGAVVACSALRRSYRDELRTACPDAVVVHLDGTREQLASRLGARLDHFMPASLLDTQLTTLEHLDTDEAGVRLGIGSAPDQIAADAVRWLRTRSTAGANR